MQAMNDTNLTVAELFRLLGFPYAGADVDACVRGALIELYLRRQAELPPEIGTPVKVVALADEETFEVSGHLMGCVGTVLAIHPDGKNIGESPKDPLFEVEFVYDRFHKEKALFFGEEIKRA